MQPGLGAIDNTCTGDDTTALLAAQTLAQTFAVNGVRPATIVFPPGCYNISPAAGWWQGVSMMGLSQPASDGSHGVIIKQTVAGADVISAVDPSLIKVPTFNGGWSLSHLTLVVNDGAIGTHPHRWPGRWFDDSAMTSGSAVLKTTTGGVTCGDTGQAIQVNGAGAAGANLVTTILSVYPCWAFSGSPWQLITLAASAGTTVAAAHTYISVANLPVTTNIGAAGIALDGYDGNIANWPAGSVNTSSEYSHIDDVTIVSASYANHGQNNSVGIYTQGVNINYALKVSRSNFNRLAFGIVQQTAEVNSHFASSNGDYQSWRDIQTNGDNVPFIASNGETTTIDNWEDNSTPIGFMVYRMPSATGDTPDGWVINNISGGGSPSTVLGWNIAGNDWTVTDAQIGNNAYIDTTYSKFTNVLGFQANIGGNTNTFDGGNQLTGTTVNGSLGSVVNTLGTNSLSMPNSKYFPAIPYKGSNHVAGRFTPDFIADGNGLLTPYNHDDLFLWPSDMMFNPSGNPIWGTYYTADSTAQTGGTFNFVSGGLGGSNFQQFDGPGGTGGIPIIGTNVPQKNLNITLSAKCDSSTTYGFKAAVFNGTATHTITGSCTTAFVTYQFVLPITSADLTHNLYFAGTTANNFRVQWIDIQPQTNADMASALSAASALPNGTTATTQAAADNTTNVATDAFVQSGYLPLTGGTLTGSNVAPSDLLHVVNNGSDVYVIPTTELCPNLAGGDNCFHQLGVANATNNLSDWQFHYVATGSASNYGAFSLDGQATPSFAYFGNPSAEFGETSPVQAPANGIAVGTTGQFTVTGTGAAAGPSLALNADTAFTAGPRAFLTAETGSLTAIIANGQYSPAKIVRAGTLENIEGLSSSFTCPTPPTFTLEDCGATAGVCGAPTALGSVTITAAGTTVDGTITSATLIAGHYLVWETTAGVCTAVNIDASAEYRMN